MLGYNTSTTTEIWVQTDTVAEISIAYHLLSNPNDIQQTQKLITEKSNAYTIVFSIKNLIPGSIYVYEAVINGKNNGMKGQFQTQPTEKIYDFSVATGSCACLRDKSSRAKKSMYDAASGYMIYKNMAKQKPNYMLWLGDNIYLRNGEWKSFEGICYRYTHTRSLPQMQDLLRNTHHFATWDDHDYGANNGNFQSKSKDFALQGFQTFWANPSSHPQNETGIYYDYKIGDAHFFMTDDRCFRSPDTLPDNENKAFLGKIQLDWLLSNLEKSESTFKLVAIGTQFLNPNMHTRKEGYWKQYRTEAQYLLNEIKRRKILGVLFLTGDVHYTMLSKLENQDFYPFYDLTVSALTSIQNPCFGTKNPWKVKGTFVWEHNFAMLKFKGNGENRRIEIENRNKFGIRKWKKVIWAKELKMKG